MEKSIRKLSMDSFEKGIVRCPLVMHCLTISDWWRPVVALPTRSSEAAAAKGGAFGSLCFNACSGDNQASLYSPSCLKRCLWY